MAPQYTEVCPCIMQQHLHVWCDFFFGGGAMPYGDGFSLCTWNPSKPSIAHTHSQAAILQLSQLCLPDNHTARLVRSFGWYWRRPWRPRCAPAWFLAPARLLKASETRALRTLTYGWVTSNWATFQKRDSMGSMRGSAHCRGAAGSIRGNQDETGILCPSLYFKSARNSSSGGPSLG